MEAKAIGRHVRLAPRKVRVVVDQIRGKYADEALELLQFVPRRAAKTVAKVLASAVANAQVKGDVATDELIVKEAFVNKGSTLKRWLPRARGMATRVNKMTSHITIVVGQPD
jgi:large subunit ribosomal protein L22